MTYHMTRRVSCGVKVIANLCLWNYPQHYLIPMNCAMEMPEVEAIQKRRDAPHGKEKCPQDQMQISPLQAQERDVNNFCTGQGFPYHKIYIFGT